jgi:hypothetical protein
MVCSGACKYFASSIMELASRPHGGSLGLVKILLRMFNRGAGVDLVDFVETELS